MKRLALLAVLVASPVAAEERTVVRLAVGERTEIEVGFAMGHQCDDESIVAAEMKNKTAETNVFALRGKQPGTTVCRAGTYLVENRPSFVFEIVVTAPVKPPPPKR